MNFLVPGIVFTLGKTQQFFCLFGLGCGFVSVVCFEVLCHYSRDPKQRMSVGPQKGAFKAQSQAIYRDLNHDGYNLLPTEPRWVLISRDPIDQAQT
jgi:hypothetical protein